MASGNAPMFFNATAQRLDPPQIDPVTNGIIIRALTAFIAGQAVAKTGNYTVGAVATDVIGTIFTNEGAAGAVIFTLPSPTSGAYYFFAGMVAQTLTIAAAAAIGVTVNNAAATSISYATAGQQIGSFAVAIAVGNRWLLVNIGTNVPTVA